MLADFHRGGQGVTAIALEDCIPTRTFWVAMTQDCARQRKACLVHVKWILGEIQDLYCNTNEWPRRYEKVSARIARRSITLGKAKVKNYSNILVKLLAKVNGQPLNDASESLNTIPAGVYALRFFC